MHSVTAISARMGTRTLAVAVLEAMLVMVALQIFGHLVVIVGHKVGQNSQRFPLAVLVLIRVRASLFMYTQIRIGMVMMTFLLH